VFTPISLCMLLWYSTLGFEQIRSEEMFCGEKISGFLL
jgi:hypothetical protein